MSDTRKLSRDNWIEGANLLETTYKGGLAESELKLHCCLSVNAHNANLFEFNVQYFHSVNGPLHALDFEQG